MLVAYPGWFRARAVELTREEAKPIAEELDIADRCWQNWLRQTDIDQGDREELTTRNARSCRGWSARNRRWNGNRPLTRTWPRRASFPNLHRRALLDVSVAASCQR
jgi:hypothetical protein